MLKNVADSLQIVGGNMISDIGIRGYQPGPVFAVNNFKRANEGIYVFRRKFPFKMLKAKLPDILRHAAFKPVGFHKVWQDHLYR